MKYSKITTLNEEDTRRKEIIRNKNKTGTGEKRTKFSVDKPSYCLKKTVTDRSSLLIDTNHILIYVCTQCTVYTKLKGEKDRDLTERRGVGKAFEVVNTWWFHPLIIGIDRHCVTVKCKTYLLISID